jgi:hypothetical protein
MLRKDIFEKADAVQTREDLAVFVLALRTDLVTDNERWENPTLDRYLEAFAAWCADMPGYFKNQGRVTPDQPDWNLVAQMMIAASLYE